MSEEIAKLRVVIEDNIREFDARLDTLERNLRETAAEGRRTEKSLGGVASGAGVLRNALMAFAGSAAIIAFKRMVSHAMEAQEATSKMQTIFGESTESVRSWAQEFGQAAARSSRELESLAADMMAIVSPMSETREQAITMSQGLVQAAQDLASFHNTSVSEAFASLRSGITGETEPLKKFGILLTDAALQEYALTQGITKKISAMTTAEKTQLRYNAILAKMGDASGDAARTSGSLTNQLKALQGTLQDVSVTIGSEAIPGITNLTRGLNMVAQDNNSVVIQGLVKIAGAIGGISDAFGRELQAEGYARQITNLADELGLMNDVLIATPGVMSEALGDAGLGGIDNVAGMLSNEIGRMTVEFEVASHKAGLLEGVLVNRYGSMADAARHSTDSQVVQYNRLKNAMETLRATAERTFEWDLRRGWLENIADTSRYATPILRAIARAQEQANRATRGATGAADAARQAAERRAKFEEGYTKKVIEQSEDRLAVLRYEYEQELALARKIGADTSLVDAFYTLEMKKAAQERAEAARQEALDRGNTMAVMQASLETTGRGVMTSLTSSMIDFWDSIGGIQEMTLSNAKQFMKEYLIMTVTAMEKQVTTYFMAAQGIAWSKSVFDFGASLVQLSIISAKVAATMAVFETMKVAIRKMATGGIATGPTYAMIGEGEDNEAVLPLNNRTYNDLAAGIVAQLAEVSKNGAGSIINNNSNGPEQVIVQNVLDGKVISETVISDLNQRAKLAGGSIIYQRGVYG